jgi:uncharacterized protein (DUF885 family)
MNRKLQRDFDKLADRIFRTFLRNNPTEASWLGLHGTNDRRLADRSERACLDEMDTLRELVKELRSFPAAGLTIERSVDHRLALGALSAMVAQMEKFPHWRVMPQNYVDEAVFGVYVLMIRNYAPLEERARAVLGRLRQVPRLLRQARENLTNPPRVFTETAILSARGGVDFLDTAVAEFIASVRDKELREQMEGARQRARRAMSAFMEELQGPVLARSRGRFAAGKRLFAKMLRDLHGVPFTPDDLLVIGQRIYRRTLAEMREVSRRIDPRKRWEDVVEALKRDHPSARSLVSAYTRAMARARDFVERRGLVTFPPGESIEVVPTPPFARPIIPYAAYLYPAPFEKEQKGTFWVTPPDPAMPKEQREAMLQGHARAGIPVTALHEAYPGHHLQLSIANRVERPLRHLFMTSVMAEGWALYCEEMMYEQGFYRSPESRLLQLKDLLWRARRVIIDVSLHTGTMSFQEAVDDLVRKAKLERPNAEAEVRRYCASPTQPMSYVVGKVLILELRDDVRAHRGSDFSLRDFHDDFLSHGTLPVDLIRREMGIPRTDGSLLRGLLRR